MRTISDFASGYIECALWLLTDDSGEPAGDGVSIHELPEETLDRLVKDADAFEQGSRELLDLANVLDIDDAHLGHDFWLTRNRHGAGFWDRGLGAIGDSLTKDAHAYGEASLYLGDDGKVYHA